MAASTTPEPRSVVAPTGKLPTDVRPLAYTLELELLPDKERFTGRVQIAVQLDEDKDLIWLHGRNMNVTRVVAVVGNEKIPASWTQANDDGLAVLNFADDVPAGSAIIQITYDAPFDRTLKGLYRVDVGEQSYAFTQFEPYSARLAFPSFDEPAFKTPYDVWITVREDHVAISNGAQVEESKLPGGLKRIHFEVTKPLPTYLVAFAVGELDVVEAEPIAPNAIRADPLPFRGVAVKGKGEQLRYALEHTPVQVEALERYFGIAYPYSKLDIIAVPDFAAGAMENAGAITFREWLLLLDPERAPESQKRAFAYVMAHELAHQWFGNLVTMPWWDDIWLNEAFATWMGNRIVAELNPEFGAELSFLERVQGAMHTDSFVSARMIRQPIESTHDISNAFDSITYSKGGGVLSMFERYLGAETFRQGVRNYLNARPFGTATAEDLLTDLSAAADKDVKTPFNTFLEQSGVPFIEAAVQCGAEGAQLQMKQSRYLPVGSGGEHARVWQVPVCARYASGGKNHETCQLLTEAEGTMKLEGGICPTWLMPNAHAAGYYRWSLPAKDLTKLRRRGWSKLEPRERLSFVDSLTAGFNNGALSARDVFATFPTLVADDNRVIATAPMGLLRFARDHMSDDAQRARVEAHVRHLYGPLKSRLGWRERSRDDGDTKLLRAEVLSFVAEVGQDAPTRRRAAQLGKKYLGIGGDQAVHPEVVATDLAGFATRMYVAEGDEAVFDAVYQRFVKEQDSTVRGRLLAGLASVRDGRSEKALSLVLDPALRVNEVTSPLRGQVSDARTRQAAWQWLETNFDALVGRISSSRAGYTPRLASGFCSEAQAARTEAFFKDRIQSLTGGPRSLATALESLRLCVARVAAQRDSSAAFFGR